MSNPFASLAPQDGQEIAGDVDRLGGGYIWDSAIYQVTVKNAYAGESKNGAKSMTFEVAGEDGRTFRWTEYVTNGKAKGQLNYYEKDGKKSYLPGFNNANAIAMFTTKKELFSQTFEEKQVRMRKPGEQTESVVPVQVAVDMLGKKFYLALLQVETNKTVKSMKDGKEVYLRTAETKVENEVSKIFFLDNKCTIQELREAQKNQTAPVSKFFAEWDAKYTGTVKNDVKAAEVTTTQGGAASPTGENGESVDSLFG